MLKVLKTFWDNFEETILTYSFLALIPLLFAQVFLRYVFNYAIPWSEELARYAFVWLIWLGAGLCVKERRHIRIDVITSRFPERVYKIFECIITLISIAFCVFLLYKSLSVVSMVARLKQTSPALKIPMSAVYASVPVSCAMMIIHYIEYLFKLFKGSRADQQEEA